MSEAHIARLKWAGSIIHEWNKIREFYMVYNGEIHQKGAKNMEICEKDLGELVNALEVKLKTLTPGTEDYTKVSKALCDLYPIWNESRKVSNEFSKTQNESLRIQNETLNVQNESLKIQNESKSNSIEMFKAVSNVGMALGTLGTNVFLIFQMLKFEQTGMIRDPVWKNLPRFKWPNW